MVPLALRVLDAGKSVLVEKPGGAALADLPRLADAARAPGAIAQVGYNVRFAESVTRARLLLDRGAHRRRRLRQRPRRAARRRTPDPAPQSARRHGRRIVDHRLPHARRPVVLLRSADSVNARVRKYERLSGTRKPRGRRSRDTDLSRTAGRLRLRRYDRLEWFESSRITFHGTGGLLEIGILPHVATRLPARGSKRLESGLDALDVSHFTTPFARTEDNRFSELPELDNIDFFRREMQSSSTASAPARRSPSRSATRWTSPSSWTPVTAPSNSKGPILRWQCLASRHPHANPRRRRTRNNPHPGP